VNAASGTLPTEADRIADQLTRSYSGDARGDAWFGLALRPLLRKIAPTGAAWRPLRNRHNIWELVLHLIANIDFVLARLDEQKLELTTETHWPKPAAPTPAAWKDALSALDARYEKLLEQVRALDDDQLAERVAGRPYSVYVMLHGIIQHNVYHAGQIALLASDVSDETRRGSL
jgi:DinB family.